jgi:hypothetical protein
MPIHALCPILPTLPISSTCEGAPSHLLAEMYIITRDQHRILSTLGLFTRPLLSSLPQPLQPPLRLRLLTLGQAQPLGDLELPPMKAVRFLSD